MTAIRKGLRLNGTMTLPFLPWAANSRWDQDGLCLVWLYLGSLKPNIHEILASTLTGAATTGTGTERGDDLFHEYGVICHGDKGSPFSTVALNEVAGGLDDAILSGFISKGLSSTSVPGFSKTLTDEQIEDLVAFIRYQKDSNTPKSLSGDSTRAIYQDHEGTPWCGTSEGLNRFNPENEQFVHFQNDPDTPNSLSDNWVRSFYEDPTGTVWIGTGGGGLDQFDPESERFAHYVNDPSNPDSLSDNHISHIKQESKGMLWIDAGSGIDTPRPYCFFRFVADRKSLRLADLINE